MVENEIIRRQVKAVVDKTIRYRRLLHGFAEIGGEEYKTRQLIIQTAEQLELPYEELEGTGVIVTLDTGRSGKTIVLRADMDALSMPENECNIGGKKRTCMSQRPDIRMHACGHDAHTAMLLGSMEAITSIRETFSGTVLFCFEQGEEDASGIKYMVSALQKRKVDGSYAMHVTEELPAGSIAIDKGAVYAGVLEVRIKVKGLGGHGARPDLSINPVFAAASMMNNLAVAWSNQIDADETATLGITNIVAGDTWNVIPQNALLLGSVRFFNEKEGKKAADIIVKVATHTAAMYGCEVEIAPVLFSPGVPTVNDTSCAELGIESIGSILGSEKIAHINKSYVSETFGYYLDKYPGILAKLGIKNEEKGITATLHHQGFDIDEDALEVGVLATVKYALTFLES